MSINSKNFIGDPFLEECIKSGQSHEADFLCEASCDDGCPLLLANNETKSSSACILISIMMSVLVARFMHSVRTMFFYATVCQTRV